MKNNPFAHIVGIVESQSVAYVRATFSALTAGEMVVPLRADDDVVRMESANVSMVIEVVASLADGNWFQPTLSIPYVQTPVYVSFTSGTEGLPKAVFISGAALNNTIERLQSVMQMNGSVKEYIGVPVYHSFGFGRCRHIAAVGGSCYIPENGFDPLELSTLLIQKQVNALSLVPSLLRMLIQEPSLLGDERHGLLWLEIGSQMMTAEEKKLVRALFPNAKIVQHYGLTEASRSTLLQIDNVDDDKLASVGRCYGNSEVTINDSGRICIRGAHLASCIQQNKEPLALIGTDGWFETSDLGRLENDYLYFLGRADNVVNCGGQKLSTEVLESAVILQLMSDSFPELQLAVSRIENATYGEGFLLSYRLAEDAKDISGCAELIRSVASMSLSDLGVSAKNAIVYQSIAELPKTATGKVQHRELVRLYTDKNGLPSADNSFRGTVVSDRGALTKSIADTLGLSFDVINMKESISDVGIDSLQTVRLSIVLDTALGYLPTDWRDQPLENLISLSFDTRKTTRSPVSDEDRQRRDSLKKAPPLWDGSSNRNPSDVSFFSLLKEDYATHDRNFFSQGLFALFVNRFGNWRMGIRTKVLRFPMSFLYCVLRKMVQVFCGIKLDYTVQVGRRVKLEHFGGMILGARKIGDDTIIRQNTTFGIRDMSDLSAKPIIEEGVNIGVGVVIVGDIVVGRHSIIGPNCVVSDDVPAFSVVSMSKPTVEALSSHGLNDESVNLSK